MSPGWESLFDELVELEAEARAARLADVQATDPELARFVGELLVADDAAVTSDDLTLATPIGLRASSYVARALEVSEPAPAATDRSGERIEAWRLVSPLGRGGMAEVYLAERVDGEFEQRAALKLVRSEVGSETIYRRFLRERRILAQLEHPGIARLLDGGRTASGEPYFVLELVEGPRITDHCETAGLTLASRLRLFAEACDAVDAAHRRLVVHRDLKPSNILVTPAGQVKLLDFGIAKLLDTGRESGTPIPLGSGSMTRLEAQPLTPSYAAPEQILGEPISTATDVFALGILLYELVTGKPPFERKGESRGALALEVATETLTAPSTTLRRLAAAAVLQQRELLRRRAAQVHGDLDTVIGKALAREPERRYRSAAELADDVRSFLALRPVRARPDSLAYRSSRFVARHRTAVAVASLAGLALIALVAVALLQGQAARRQAQRAERVRAFLVELFKGADPSRTRGATLTAREMIENGAVRVEQELASEPEIAAELLDAIAQVENSLGLAAEATSRAQRAVELRASTNGATSTLVLASQVTLAEALFSSGDLDRTEAAIAAARPLLDRRADFALASRLLVLEASWLTQLGEYEAAVERARVALARAEEAHGVDSLEALVWTTRLASQLLDASKVAEAVALLRPKLPALRAEHEGNALRLAEARLIAGDVLAYAGDHAEGKALAVEAVQLMRRRLGAEHPEVALAEIKLGFMVLNRREFDAAKPILEHAATVLERFGHYEAGAARRYLGFVHLEKGEYAAALGDFEAAEKVFRELLPDEANYPLSARQAQGLALLRLGETERAETILREIASEFERLEGPNGNSLRSTLKYLGEARRQRGDAAEALALHHRARDMELAIFGTEDHASLAVSDLQIALDLLASKDPEALAEARTRVDRAIAFQRKTAADDPRLGDFLVASARIAWASGDRVRAERELAEGRAALAATRGADHPLTIEAAKLRLDR